MATVTDVSQLNPKVTAGEMCMYISVIFFLLKMCLYMLNKNKLALAQC